MRWIIKQIKKLCCLFTKPSVTIGLGILVTGGFIAGIIFWTSFEKGLELTTKEEFCVSCHTMGHNLEELKETIHWSNRSGVRAYCSDCHVPHNFTDKIARKVQASRELFAHLKGDISTKEKFEEKRIVLAQREWKRMSANGSKECRSCHDYNNMDFDKMSITAQMEMKNAAELNTNCIECHKGIAHKLPQIANLNNPDIDKLLNNAKSATPKINTESYNIMPQNLYADADLKEVIGSLEIAAKIKVIEQKNNAQKIELSLWKKNKGYGRVWYEYFGLNAVSAIFEKDYAQDTTKFTVHESKEDPFTGLEWQKVTTNVWVKSGGTTQDIEQLWQVAKMSYSTNCSVCHVQQPVDHFDTNTWPGIFSGMVGFTNMDGNTSKLVLKYLQFHSSDFKEKDSQNASH